MNEVDLRLMRAAVAVAEELNFSRAAIRLHISQPALTKQIQDLEGFLKTKLFERDHQRVSLTDPGRAFIEEAKLALMHHQRAIQAARTVASGAEAVLNLGQSPYVDPLLSSVAASIRLPLFPDLRLRLFSDFSPELARRVALGEIDVALGARGIDSPQVSSVEIDTSPLYLLLEEDSDLADNRSLELCDLRQIPWILFPSHVNPVLHDLIERRAAACELIPPERHQATTPEQAAQLVFNTHGVAFLSKHGAWKVALDGLTMRPLDDPDIRARTVLMSRNDAGRLVSEFVRATVTKIKRISAPRQRNLPLAV